jgi:hypothetical protein
MKFNKQARQVLKSLGVPKYIRNGVNPKLMGYAALIYFGLRALDRSGVLPQRAHDILASIDDNIEDIKDTLGFQTNARNKKAV